MPDQAQTDQAEQVHKMWLKKHDNLPASKSEKREYSALVAKVVSLLISLYVASRCGGA